MKSYTYLLQQDMPSSHCFQICSRKKLNLVESYYKTDSSPKKLKDFAYGDEDLVLVNYGLLDL